LLCRVDKNIFSAVAFILKYGGSCTTVGKHIGFLRNRNTYNQCSGAA
jgi:hypothetical protein